MTGVPSADNQNASQHLKHRNESLPRRCLFRSKYILKLQHFNVERKQLRSLKKKNSGVKTSLKKSKNVPEQKPKNSPLKILHKTRLQKFASNFIWWQLINIAGRLAENTRRWGAWRASGLKQKKRRDLLGKLFSISFIDKSVLIRRAVSVGFKNYN